MRTVPGKVPDANLRRTIDRTDAFEEELLDDLVGDLARVSRGS